MKFITEKRNTTNLKILIPIIIVIILIFLGVIIASSISNGKNNNDNIKNSEKEVDNKKANEQKEEKETEEKKDELVLLNTELKLSDVCKNKAGICTATIGEFSLGGNVHTLKVNIDMADPYNDKLYQKYNNSTDRVINDENSNAIYIDSKKIPIKPFESLDKIIKIGEDHFAIGVDLYTGANYKIIVYDKDINFAKTYNSVHVPKQPKKEDEEETKDYSDYFTVENNTFTRYACDTSNDTGDGKNQFVEKYKIIVSDETFNEQRILKEEAYCSAQH
ncbi:MAG: hypothetical protein E7158_06635 [Firmicutes bacterium]|nr:hypothetical protein [Bacillota bacterium]